MAYIGKRTAYALFAMGLLLILGGCAVGNGGKPSAEGNGEVAVSASFRREDGAALGGGTVRLSYGAGSTDHPLDDEGTLKIPGLPRRGDLELTVLDRHERIQGMMTVSLSEGAVIDAATDESGVGHITLRADTDEIALFFVLKDDGSLLCTLQLSQREAD